MSWTTVTKASSGSRRTSLKREQTVPRTSPVTLIAKDPPGRRSSLCLLSESCPGDAHTRGKCLIWKCRNMELSS